jgi:NADPH:quinone reductase-like Zn-dependent oxidoreductase
MLHSTTKVYAGQRVLIHGASGGNGTALIQLWRLAKLEKYRTFSPGAAPTVSKMGATTIDFTRQDFITEIISLTADGVDVVFDPIGSGRLWESRNFLHRGGRIVGCWRTKALRGYGLNPTTLADEIGFTA